MNVAETLGNKELSNSQSSQPGKYVALTHPLYDYIARHRSRVVDHSSMHSAPGPSRQAMVSPLIG